MKKENYEEHKLEWQRDGAFGMLTPNQENKYDAMKENPPQKKPNNKSIR